MKYFIYIKSHCEAPDFENEVVAISETDAIEKFYAMLQGEYSREDIKRYMASEEDIYGDQLPSQI